jgi:hypothetical protein
MLSVLGSLIVSQWVRLWEDMPNDPKWRSISVRCGRPVGEIISVFVHMMTNAGAWDHWGILKNWSDEDVAAALDFKHEHVTAIREAMQGKTLAGDHLSGWESRQTKSSDQSAERTAAWRKRKRDEANQGVTASDGHVTVGDERVTAGDAEEKRRDKKIDSVRTESIRKSPPKSEFDVFYRAYPKHVGRKEAAKSHSVCVAAGVDPAQLVASAVRFAEAHLLAGTDKQFIPAPAVWLNQARYDDEDLPAPSSNGHGRSNGTTSFVKSVLEDIENDKRRREESNFKIIPMLQRNGGRYGQEN